MPASAAPSREKSERWRVPLASTLPPPDPEPESAPLVEGDSPARKRARRRVEWRRRECGGASSSGSAAADPRANARSSSTRRTSPSPATVTHLAPFGSPGTNSAEKMLCRWPVNAEPRRGKPAPVPQTHTHRSSEPERSNDASSFHATALTHPACFSRTRVRRRPRRSQGCEDAGPRRRLGSHSRDVTLRNTDARGAGGGIARGGGAREGEERGTRTTGEPESRTRTLARAGENATTTDPDPPPRGREGRSGARPGRRGTRPRGAREPARTREGECALERGATRESVVASDEMCRAQGRVSRDRRATCTFSSAARAALS